MGGERVCDFVWPPGVPSNCGLFVESRRWRQLIEGGNRRVGEWSVFTAVIVCPLIAGAGSTGSPSSLLLGLFLLLCCCPSCPCPCPCPVLVPVLSTLVGSPHRLDFGPLDQAGRITTSVTLKQTKILQSLYIVLVTLARQRKRFEVVGRGWGGEEDGGERRGGEQPINE